MIDYSNIICKCYSKDLLDKNIPEICNNEYMFFLNKPNVVGVGFGFKCIKNIYTKEKCIAVFVEKKVPKNLLSSCNVIPKIYKGIRTDVVETGTFFPLSLNDRIRPVPGGYSVINSTENALGTMACTVTDDENNIYMLSNNHILASYNRAPIGSAIIQPAWPFGGKYPDDTVANLSKYVPIKFITETVTPENFVDCAIAKAIDPNILSSDIKFIGKPKGVIIPRIGYGVKKVGATTELTSGLILYTDVTQIVKPLFVGKFLIKQCVICTEKAEPADSGALLVDANDYAIGLLIGRGTKQGYISHCLITTVLSSLNVKLITA